MKNIFEKRTALYLSRKGACCLAAVLLMFASCTKDDFLGLRSRGGFVTGEKILFSTQNTSAAMGTKTEYYLSETEGSKKWYNGIKWNLDDRISILCDQARIYNNVTGQWLNPIAEYKVINSPATLGDGEAQIYNASDDEDNPLALEWGNQVDHLFKAIYPAVGTQINGETLVEYVYNGGFSYYRYRLPARQVYKEITNDGNGNYEAKPHMEYLPLLAGTTVHPNNSSNYGIREDGTKKAVFLDFKPRAIAVHFSIVNGYSDNNAMWPEYIKIDAAPYTSSLTGTASTGALYPEVFDTSSLIGQGYEVRMDFPSDLVIQNGKTLQFTVFFLNFNNVSNLTFILKDRNREKIKKVALSYSNGTFLTFPKEAKSYLHGIVVEDDQTFKWDVAFDAKAAWWLDTYKELPLQPE